LPTCHAIKLYNKSRGKSPFIQGLGAKQKRAINHSLATYAHLVKRTDSPEEDSMDVTAKKNIPAPNSNLIPLVQPTVIHFTK
jgi:hypothetical protein